MKITEELFKLQDTDYKSFHSKLMPTVDADTIIGVRVPVLRKFSKDLSKTFDVTAYSLPHEYYEENNLHAFLIEHIKDFSLALYETERFLPYIDNWATCDMFFPKVFKKHPEIILEKIREWIKSEHTYTVRYAIGLLMRMFLDDNFKDEYADMVADITSDEYYINMMRAWYFATALAKQYDKIIPIIKEKKLDVWTHNKTIQKALESYRIDKETKEYLKEFKIKP